MSPATRTFRPALNPPRRQAEKIKPFLPLIFADQRW